MPAEHAGGSAIAFEHVSFSYGDVAALRDVTFSAARGRLTALVGGNGSGKSTAAKLICALELPATGTVRVLGYDTATDPFAVRQRVGIVFQNPEDQLVASIVENEVAFGPENLGLPQAELRRRVDDALARVGLEGFQKRLVETLSGGQKQKLALAGALAMRPDVLVLDEATSMLDPQSREDILRVVRTLADDGMAVLMITHAAAECALADDVIALCDGRVATQAERAHILDGASCAPTRRRDAAVRDGASIIEESFQNVSFTYDDAKPATAWALRDVTLSVHAGEFLAVIGSVGSGKSTLARHMNGLLHATEGRVLFRGRDLGLAACADETRFDVGLVFQYPERQLFAATVFDDIAFGPRNLGLDADEVETRVREAMRAVGLDFDELNARSPFRLSGGQQRRAAIAGILAMRPQMLVLDEPCAGLDAEAHDGLTQLLLSLNEQGLAIVMVTHDWNDARRLATRIVHMDDGRLVQLDTKDAAGPEAPAASERPRLSAHSNR